jgi:uncharacterized protein (UPF0276 family)
MASIRLAILASKTLVELWPQESVRPDLLEVTTWMDIDDILEYRDLLPDEPVLLHGGNLLGAPLTKKERTHLRMLVAQTGAPWLSVRISLWPWQAMQEARQRGRKPTALDLGTHLEQFFVRVRALRESLGIPLLLKNVPSLPGMENDPENDPETIAAVLQATGCSFLLDLSCAQTAARNWGYENPRHYLSALPLERIVEVHVSAPGHRKDGQMVDSHESLREEDYLLLDWLLSRATPQVVTLEYWKDPKALVDQTLRLKKELSKERTPLAPGY